MHRLFLIRHGRPDATWGGTSSDPGLAEIGRAQAEDAARQLREYGPLQVVSSPMLRCRETAAPYARWRGVEPVIEPRVSEIVADEGVEDRAAWLQTRFPWRDRANMRQWASLEPRLHAWRAEMLDCLRALRTDAAIFTHFIAINVIVGAAMGSDDTIVCTPDHASITEIAIDGDGFSLVRLGADMRVDDVR